MAIESVGSNPTPVTTPTAATQATQPTEKAEQVTSTTPAATQAADKFEETPKAPVDINAAFEDDWGEEDEPAWGKDGGGGGGIAGIDPTNGGRIIRG